MTTTTKKPIIPIKTNSPVLNIGLHVQNLETKLEFIRNINVEIEKNQLDMITSIKLDFVPIEPKIPEKTVKIMPIEFDTLDDLFSLLSKSINKINKEWQDKTIAIRSQLTLFD